jgi:hypothetical protein
LNETVRRESMLQLRSEILQLNELLQVCHDVGDETMG